MLSKIYKKKPKALAAFLSAAVLFGAVCPKMFQAYNLDRQNDWQHEAVIPTWQDDKIAEATGAKLVPTGLGFNFAPYPGWREPGGSFWPLGAETFLQKRSGWDNTGFEMFEGRHTYCTGNHINAAGIQPAARVFASREDYYYDTDESHIFPYARHGNVKFNFLMLVIACNYPGDYKVPDNTELPSEFAAEQIVSQAIAWFCTNDDSPGFTGDWASDFNLFRHGYTNYEPYNSMMGNFAGRNPEIHAKLHASPNPESAAAKAGMTNNAEAWFWDIWHSTYLTSLLSADWDKGITTYHTAVQERDGEYHAYIDLFATPEAKIYLNGITFEPYGDWQAVGQEADGTYHFVSASGETDENGCIGDLTWPEGKIGALLPIDYTKAHIRTFDTWNANYTSAPGFGHTQTQFASYIEKGLKLYITTQKTSEGDSKVSVNRHEHKETWESNYTVDLHKFDSETGKPLEGSHWDILEMFDDSQLDNTDLDREPDAPGSYESGIGSLNQTEWGDDEISSNYSGDMGVNISDTNKYNWGNDGGTQFERWDNPYNDPCRRDDNVTGKDGQLYEIDSAGVNSGTKAHTDTYNYTYYKGYCDGHPAPEIEYVECDHNEDEDCDCDEINQELHDEVWEAWYAEVEKCEQLVEEGGFFHCIEPGDAAKKAMEEDRDQFYKDFISLTYDYSAEEITAAKGYIIHGTHTDDIPIEWRVVTASEYKDTSEATAIDHNGPSGSGSGETGGTGEPGGGNIGGSGSGSGGGNGDDGNDDDLEDQEITGTVISVDLDKKIITVENMDLETYTFSYARAEKDGDIEYYSEEEIKVGDTVEVQFRKNREPYPASYIYVYEPDEGGPGMNTLFQEARQISVGLVKETVKAEETAIGSRDTMEAADSSGDTKDTTDGSIDTKEEATGNRQEDTGEDTPENILGDTERSHEDASGQGTEQEVLGGRQEADETATVSEAGRGTTVTSSRKRSSETENGHLDTDKNTHGTDGQTEDEETETEDPEEDILADIDIFEDGAVSLDGSSATASNARPKTEKTQTGLVSQAASRAKGLLRFFGLSDDDGEDEENGDSGSGSYLRNSIPFQPFQANTVKPPASDIIDWTFIVYDHRTEGEIHFNKRDFDLRNDEGTLFDAYAMENGDGTLEGAVYGLFAAEDIVHPDTSAGDDAEQGTGIVFQKGDLVAVATTDRNGDASFMAVTEAPGSVYNYASGSIEHTDWYDVAPKNLHIPEQESAAKERDMESFIGHNPDNSEITAGNGMDLTDTQEGNGTYFKKYSSNQNYDSGMLAGNEVTNSSADTYQDTETTGYYPIQDCESNNGNCWIGRPLLIGPDGSSYYIKELSRSEGYELSVYGKSDVLATNRNAFLEGSDVTTSSGTSQVSGMVSDRENGGTTYSITSADTDQGYIVHLTNIPENATISITSTEGVWDDSVSHYETKLTYTPVAATEGAPVMVGGRTWAAEIGDTIQYNGSEHTVNNVYTITHDRSTVAPDNAEKIENPYLDVSAVTESGNIANDINRLFTKNGYRTPVEGSPWVVVEAESFNLPYVAKAINEQLFTDDWYSAFNAMKMVDNYQLGGHYYIVIAYSYRYAKTSNSIYNEANDKIYVKTAADYSGLSGGKEGYIYRVYDAADCENVERNSNGFVTKATVPNQTASGSAVYHRGDPYGSISFATRENETFWAYAAGETLLDINGEPVLQENREQVSVTPTFVMKVTNVEVTLGSYQQTGTSGDGYGYGDYTYTVSQDTLDGLENGTLKFRITFDQDDSKTSSRKDNFTAKNGHVSISLPLAASGSYIENIVLTYPGQEKTFQDAGTIKNPTGVLERPIRQKVRIEKDIQTLPETKQVWYCLNCGYENQDGVTACGFCNRARSTEETRSIDYAHDTYAAVHSDNISAERDGGWYETAKDWLGSLLKGNSPEEEPESIGNFRFKAYLKSNLERLYRDEDGHVVWMDRNGNTMTPQYKDTNGDGNYDTFTWKYDTAYGGKTVDFPEKDKVSGDGISGTLAEDAVLLSSNVQKIYTDVEHRTGSMTTSARANNLWDTYADPQDGHRENAGQIEGYTTSERETRSEGDAVTTNASLYSYDGILRDRDRSDYLQDEQNHGYTRLLETQRVQIEDGTGLILGILITVSGLSARLNRDYLYMTMYDSFYLGLEETMMEAAQRIDLAELVKKEVSDEYFGAISRCGALTDITSAGCILTGSVVSIISILIVASSVSLWIVVAALAYVAFILVVNVKMADKVRVVFKEVREHWRKATYIKNLVKEGDTAKETRIYSSVDKLKQEWTEARNKADAIVLRGERGQAMVRILCQIGLYVFLTLVMAIGLIWLDQGKMNPETLLMLFTLGVSISEAVAKISECYQQLNYGIYGLGLQREFLEKTPAMTEEEEAFKKDTPLTEQICFWAEHIDFSYGDGEKVLNDLSFTISKGETVAIVGANGSGKTTLLKLLMGLYRPDSGILTFQGRNYEEYKQGYLSQKIGAFFQDFILFHLTVKENVGLGNIDYMDEEEMIWDALRKGGAATMVFSWKKKLEERLLRYVYRDGLMLSGGESQRLAVSRTHMSDKEILIFDEPASMLDPIAELEQFRHIKEKLSGHTALLVSHRIGFARLADRILVLDQGRIAESGTHEELMAAAGLYAKLFQEQAQWYQVSEGGAV